MLNILSHPTISYSKLHFVLESALGKNRDYDNIDNSVYFIYQVHLMKNLLVLIISGALLASSLV